MATKLEINLYIGLVDILLIFFTLIWYHICKGIHHISIPVIIWNKFYFQNKNPDVPIYQERQVLRNLFVEMQKRADVKFGYTHVSF